MKKRSCLASVLVIFLLAVPAWCVKRPHKLTKLGAGVYLASEFDAAATYHLLQTCGSRCYEANPIVRPFAHNPGVFVVVGTSAYAVNYFARRLNDHGHPRWATALRIFAIGLHVGAGAPALIVASGALADAWLYSLPASAQLKSSHALQVPAGSVPD